MPAISLEEYKRYIKDVRPKWFDSPYALALKVFTQLHYIDEDCDFFFDHASEVVEKMRENCWDTFVPVEREFTSKMLGDLIDEKQLEGLNAREAVARFVQDFPDYIYVLTLSNTQSRRSRAGKEFEAIIEFLLSSAGVTYDSQGKIGKEVFLNKGLGKMVDLVVPGVDEYIINKRNTVLISAKTTLRERWQEVPEEMGRTGAREMFLATLDETISGEVLSTLYEANIQVVTTKRNIESNYSNNSRILSFEKLLKIANDVVVSWDLYHDRKK